MMDLNDAIMNSHFQRWLPSYGPAPGALPQATMMLRLWRETHSSQKGELGEEGDFEKSITTRSPVTAARR